MMQARLRDPIAQNIAVSFAEPFMAVFDREAEGDPAPDISERYRPRWRELYSVAEARARFLTLKR
jgi:hypothetical protein